MSSPRVTECFLIRNNRVLLGRKKRGLGTGKIVGIGGKCSAGETAADCAIREIFEETGAQVLPNQVEARGMVEWRFPNKTSWEMIASVFVVRDWQNTIAETDEIEPLWFDFDAVPYDLMWADARMWLPRIFAGEHVNLVFVYNEDNETVATMNIA